MITFYHTGCPKCRILEIKMKAKNIEFTECSDVEEMQQKGIMSVPQLEVDGIMMDFVAANKWINERN